MSSVPSVSPLESVLTTAELEQRPSRAPEFEAQSQALVGLMKGLQAANSNMLQELAEAALRLCRAHSAGISIEEEEHGRRIFRWHGAAGEWSRFLQGPMPREASPCGIVVDTNAPLLMSYPERHFRYGTTGIPPLVETLLVPFTVDGVTVGTVWVISHADSCRFDREDLRLLGIVSEFAAVAYQVLQRATEVRDALAKERAGSQLLQAISAGLVCESDIDALYAQILDAAMTIMRSDCASMQMLGDEGELRLLAWSGFHPDSARAWRLLRFDSKTACGQALESGERYVIRDTEQSALFTSAADLEDFRRSGIRAVQSTPLRSRSGPPVGVISTHWREPHEPSAADLRLFDVLVRLAADLVERARTEQALREADQRKNEFLAVLSHELRNPLAPLNTGLELLQRSGNKPELVASIHSMMGRQVAHLTRLVGDLLDLSRITRGTVELQCAPLELRVVIEAALELARPLIDQRQHTLVVEHADRALPVDGDLDRLTQVVSNVLGNAARYTDPQGRITLLVSADGPEAVIRVRDSGLGIPERQLEDVFEMFTQVPEHRMRSGGGGLGIGLALSRRLIELHRGSITASSPGLGEGSEFVIRLPLAAATGGPVRNLRRRIEAAAARQRVLIIDDNVDAGNALAPALESLGHSVRVAHDGSHGLDGFEHFAPDVVLLDIGLPMMDGYEVARRIRMMPAGDSVLLVALTGWGQQSDRASARAAGFDYHLVKPVSLEALGTVIDTIRRPTAS